MVTEAILRDKILTRASAEVGKVQANVIGSDGKVVGWRDLRRILAAAAPHTQFGRNNELFTHTVGMGEFVIPNWCGIFATFALQAARGHENVGNWPVTSCLEGVSGVTTLPKGSRPEKGDVGWKPTAERPKDGHFVVVREVLPDESGGFSIQTIEGNAGKWSEIAEPSTPQLGGTYQKWFTIFDTQGEADVRKALTGVWNVTVQWKPWRYTFSGTNGVRYTNPAKTDETGTGNWSMDGKKIRIQWDGLASWERWDLPIVKSGQVGLWYADANQSRESQISARKVS